MVLSETHKFIFMHIYKTAGSSISRALEPYAKLLDPQIYPPHIKTSELILIMGEQAYKSFFSFAFVRNPWDWQVSLYTYMLTSQQHHQHALVKGFGNFEGYIRWRCDKEVRFQKDFIFSENGEQLVDFIGKYERLDDDFADICTRIGISTSLPKINVSKTKPYQEYYTPETVELVRQTFEPDIRIFHYDFQ